MTLTTEGIRERVNTNYTPVVWTYTCHGIEMMVRAYITHRVEGNVLRCDVIIAGRHYDSVKKWTAAALIRDTLWCGMDVADGILTGLEQAAIGNAHLDDALMRQL